MYEHTSDETTDRHPYANTRPRDGVYSITDTQSGNGTYAAGEFSVDESGGSTSAGTAAGVDCADPEACSTCGPTTTGTA